MLTSEGRLVRRTDPAGTLRPGARRLSPWRQFLHDLRDMGETNAMAARLRRPTRREVFARAAAIYASRFPDRDDPSRIRATFDLVFLTGWAPAENQQKPLRPGSAKMSLADALSQTRDAP